MWGFLLVQFCGVQGVPMFSQAGGWDPVVDGGCPAISSGRKDIAWGCIEPLLGGARVKRSAACFPSFQMCPLCWTCKERLLRVALPCVCLLGIPPQCRIALPCSLLPRGTKQSQTILSCLALLQAAVLCLACKALKLASIHHNKTRNVSTLASVQHLVQWQWRIFGGCSWRSGSDDGRKGHIKNTNHTVCSSSSDSVFHACSSERSSPSYCFRLYSNSILPLVLSLVLNWSTS